MRIILPVVFLLVAVAGVFGLTMVNTVKNGGESSNANGFAFALQYLTEGTIDAIVPEEPIGALASYLPNAPVGWTREAYQTPHGEALTEATYQPSSVVISSTNSVLGSFDRASRDVNGAAVTYRNGEEVVAISMSARSSRDMRSLQGSIMTAISGNLSSMGDLSGSRSGFATLHGVTITKGPMTSKVVATGAIVPINYRRFTAGMGGQLSLSIITNASDASLAAILAGIDIPGLNQTLTTPDLAVTPGTGLITTARGALSTEPPMPSPAYLAFNKLRTGVEGLSQDDVRLLQALANGKIAGWEGIYEEYGLHHGLSAQIVEILGEEPELPPALQVRYEAAAMMQNTARFGPYEIDILRALSTGRYQTRERAQRALLQNTLYAPPVLRLINRLPEAEKTDVADAGQEAVPNASQELIIRRGINVDQGAPLVGNCSIELGVRRCVVEGE